MGSVGVLILFMVLGAVICAKALVLFIATPVGSGLPDAISTFVSAFDQAATPALNGAGASTGSGQ